MKRFRFARLFALTMAALFMTAFARGTAEAAAKSPSMIPEDAFAQAVYTWDAEADLESGVPEAAQAKVSGHEVEASASLPLYEQDAFTFLMGGSFKWNRFEFRDVQLLNEDLYALSLPLDFAYEGPGDWSFWANVTPGLFSDLRRVNSSDYKTLFHGWAMYEVANGLTLAAGAAYDSAFGKDEWYPLGGAIWRINEQWELRLVLPSPFIFWAPQRKLLLFAGAMPAGDKWNMRDPDTLEEFDFKLESWRAGGGLEYNLTGPAWFHISAGADLERNYDISNDGQTLLDSKADDTFFVRTGLVFR